MLSVAIILFIIAAVFGLIILTSILKDRPTPKPIVFIHGPVAAVALILVIIYAIMQGASPLLITSIVLFIIAALGGLTLFTIDMSKRPIPKLLATLHPVIAAAGLIVLIIYAVQ